MVSILTAAFEKVSGVMRRAKPLVPVLGITKKRAATSRSCKQRHEGVNHSSSRAHCRMNECMRRGDAAYRDANDCGDPSVSVCQQMTVRKDLLCMNTEAGAGHV